MSLLLPAAAPQPIIVMSDIWREYPPSTVALSGVNVEIAPGERVAIMGPSGSGKTTLLSIAGLLDTPTRGRYLLAGEDTSGMGDARRSRLRAHLIGFVFQGFHLVPHLTVRENVEYGLELAGRDHDARRTADAAISAVGLDHRGDAFPATLSGGEQQRVAIARAIAREPQLVLCDEPTGNLDSANTDAVLDLLLSGATGAATVVIVTHDPAVAERCSRIVHVEDGRVR